MGLLTETLQFRKLLISVSIIFFSSELCLAAVPALTRIQQAVDNEQYVTAWQEAQHLKQTYEGDAQFDFLYGVAALETQHFDYALLALKRAVANNPEQVRPRLELARTYLALNNKESAISEFKTALQLSMPAVVRSNVEQQLSVLSKAETPISQGVWRAGFNFAFGHDSNVNLGVSSASISLPIFGEVTLDDSSIKQDSTLGELGAQLAYNRVESDSQAWFINSSINTKQYPHAVRYSTKDLNLSAGKVFTNGNERYQLAVSLQKLNLRDQSYSRTQAIEASMNYKIANDKALTSAFTWSHTDYQKSSNKSQNSQTLQLSEQYQFTLGGLGHQFGVALSHELPEKKKYDYLSRDIASVGYGINKAWDVQNTSSLGLNVQRRVNQDKDLTYGEVRKDLRLTLQIAHQLQLNNNATFFANAGYVNNASNLDLYDSKKAFVKTGLSYQF